MDLTIENNFVHNRYLLLVVQISKELYSPCLVCLHKMLGNWYAWRYKSEEWCVLICNFCAQGRTKSRDIIIAKLTHNSNLAHLLKHQEKRKVHLIWDQFIDTTVTDIYFTFRIPVNQKTVGLFLFRKTSGMLICSEVFT